MFSPFFSFNSGTPLVGVSAVDPDPGENGTVYYDLLERDEFASHFFVESNTGIIIVLTPPAETANLMSQSNLTLLANSTKSSDVVLPSFAENHTSIGVLESTWRQPRDRLYVAAKDGMGARVVLAVQFIWPVDTSLAAVAAESIRPARLVCRSKWEAFVTEDGADPEAWRRRGRFPGLTHVRLSLDNLTTGDVTSQAPIAECYVDGPPVAMPGEAEIEVVGISGRLWLGHVPLFTEGQYFGIGWRLERRPEPTLRFDVMPPIETPATGAWWTRVLDADHSLVLRLAIPGHGFVYHRLDVQIGLPAPWPASAWLGARHEETCLQPVFRVAVTENSPPGTMITPIAFRHAGELKLLNDFGGLFEIFREGEGLSRFTVTVSSQLHL
ncbi:unnamed protein product [Protopolystoma xenopodis]|uniref:Cadherin domain-containing protein n=1 Tax=Protopolystoma xenopodis TaxID=117903 RepID=A0A448WQY7_9PLAT|nr:unnamed protein product [Protopolystoma xenopodis]